MSARLSSALLIVEALNRSGHTAFLVGGCVRDRLLGIEPKDYDVATSATPQQIAALFAEAETVGAHFGVSLVRIKGYDIETATFRSEGEYRDGRRPEEFSLVTDPALDARRRDFTINGLFQDPISGEIFDYVGGQKDLQSRLIRAIGNADRRFEEDHLRMLRAVRFAARLGFEVEAETMEAIQRHAAQIQRISPERVRDEVTRILVEGGAKYGLELLDQCGLLAQVLPEVKALQGVAQPPEFHPEGDVWTHTLIMLDRMRHPSLSLAFGVLLHDIGKPETYRVAERIRFDGHAEVGAAIAEKILARLKFSNQELQNIRSLVADHMKFKDIQNMRLSTLKRFLRQPRFAEHLELHRLDCQASNGRREAYEFANRKLEEFDQEKLRPAQLITGADLIAEGHHPGPGFKAALTAVESAQLEGGLHTREEALAVARKVLERTR